MEFPLNFRRSATIVLAASLLLGSCTGEAASPTPSPTPPPPVSPTVTPSAQTTVRPSVPDEPLPTRGPAALDCVNGWVTPEVGSNGYTSPLGVIRRATGIRGSLEVVDMRFFEGPESPPSEKGYLLVVQRWYVKLYAERDYSFAGRFLIEARRFGQGVAAVAPYDSDGFRSPDWIGFQYDSADLERTSYEGLPGSWAGVPYDFVEGGAGLEIPGLPEDVVGCLSGT